MTPFTINAPEPAAESRDERQIRTIRNRMKLRALRQAEKQQKEMLAVHKGAGTGRNNRDWRASSASADAAIIPDSPMLNARARQLVRDSWIGKAVVKAFSRNVVGCGIMPIPMAKDKNGKPLAKFNARLLKLFWAWANDAKACDVERRQTYWQKQSLTVEEWVTVGEHMVVWSYAPPAHDGAPVGLKLQSFEAEQFDLRLQSYTDPATGVSNQVRGGVEVDAMGAAVAYHFYTRNPNDYLPMSWNSVRIPAARVLHFFKQERTLQCRGVTAFAAVLQDTRDLSRYKEAALWRAIMESCIGVIVKQDAAAGGGLSLTPTVTPAQGTDPSGGKTPSGMQIADIVPGMVGRLLPNESAEAFIPQAGGQQYEGFTRMGLRGVGAGVGISYGQLARQNEANYSAARQDSLEDQKEFQPSQELLAHNQLLPVWNLFVRFAVMDGRLDDVSEFDAGEFAADAARFCEAEYVAPAAPWIDPEKEANAAEKMLKLKITDREEIIALRGRRMLDVFDKIQSEQAEADKRGISLPDTNDDANRDFARKAIEGFIADGTMCDVIANQVDLRALVIAAGLTPDPQYKAPFLPVTATSDPLVSGTLVKDADGDVIGGGVTKNPAAAIPAPFGGGKINGENGDHPSIADGNNGVPKNGAAPKNGSPKNGNGKTAKQDDEPIDLIARRAAIVARLAQVDKELSEGGRPPDYRAGNDAECCGTCSYLRGTACSKYGVAVKVDKVCDAWDAHAVARQDETGTRITGPYKPEGEPAIDAIQSDMVENPAYNNPQGPAGIPGG